MSDNCASFTMIAMPMSFSPRFDSISQYSVILLSEIDIIALMAKSILSLNREILFKVILRCIKKV
jgi:hypothetical protein